MLIAPSLNRWRMQSENIQNLPCRLERKMTKEPVDNRKQLTKSLNLSLKLAAAQVVFFFFLRSFFFLPFFFLRSRLATPFRRLPRSFSFPREPFGVLFPFSFFFVSFYLLLSRKKKILAHIERERETRGENELPSLSFSHLLFFQVKDSTGKYKQKAHRYVRAIKQLRYSLCCSSANNAFFFL